MIKAGEGAINFLCLTVIIFQRARGCSDGDLSLWTKISDAANLRTIAMFP